MYSTIYLSKVYTTSTWFHFELNRDFMNKNFAKIVLKNKKNPDHI